MQEINLKNIFKTLFTSIYLSFLFFGSCHASIELKILILHDQQKGSLYEKMGLAYAIMLENLLGHFNSSIKILPVTDYVSGKIEQNDAKIVRILHPPFYRIHSKVVLLIVPIM